jgi:hypothetical protein
MSWIQYSNGQPMFMEVDREDNYIKRKQINTCRPFFRAFGALLLEFVVKEGGINAQLHFSMRGGIKTVQ